METMSQFPEPVIPDERRFSERDPWFDRLTVLSEVEGLTTLSKVEGESSDSSIESHFSGSRLPSHFAGLGRDDRCEMRNVKLKAARHALGQKPLLALFHEKFIGHTCYEITDNFRG
jgi:hypothetical protein